MKKVFLGCILFLGITSLSAYANHSTSGDEKIAFKRKAPTKKSRKKTTSYKSSSRKHISSRSRHSKSARSKHHLRKALWYTKIKKGSFSFTSKTGSADKAKVYPPLTPDELRLSNDFASNRGHLPMPVNGKVSLAYGVYIINDAPIHGDENTIIRGDNPGLTFSADKKEPVKAVFDGVVSDVDTKGEISSVCIRHGKYYTVYSNLSNISVHKGDIVKQNQPIANVSSGYATNDGELMFMLMVNDDNVDPAPWLVK